MISSEINYYPSSDATTPAIVCQVTSLVDSYMLWIGATEEREENAAIAVLNGHLGRDWACAMPARTNSSVPPSGTSLFCASASDIALPMAQRLARRFKKQIFLSIDLPPSFIAMGQGPTLSLEAEKAAVRALKDRESGLSV